MTNQTYKNNEYSIHNEGAQANALVNKNLNEHAMDDGAKREKYAKDEYIKKHIDLPLVVFNQGFESGNPGKVSELPTDKGYEPSLADLRLERVHQNHPTHVHVEVTGSNYVVKGNDQIYVKAEKLKQQLRAGDDKLYLCVYGNMDREGSLKKVIPVRVPTEDLQPGGKLDISGDKHELMKRYPGEFGGADGIGTKIVAGQLMICLPPKSDYIITKEQFVEHVTQSLNRQHYDRLTPEAKAADKAFHDKLGKDEPRLKEMNESYVKGRSAITLKGGVVANLGSLDRLKVRKMGSLNSAEIVQAYREQVSWPKSSQQQLER